MENKSLPDWYWAKGLHDAEIIDYREDELSYDFSEAYPIRSVLTLSIDSTHALMENEIRQIKFFNYKIISELKNPKGIWWLSDNLTQENGKWILRIIGHGNENFVVKFDRIEVIKK